MIGEIVWLMTQSPIHRELKLKDMDWLLMPPVVLGQYKLFKDSANRPIGAALWGYLDDDAEYKLKTNGKLNPEDWGNGAKPDSQKGLIPQEGGTLWLIELVAPFHTPQNQHREQMLQDLSSTVLNGKPFKMVHVNPVSNQKEEVVIGRKLS